MGSTTIRVDEETKERLERLKADDETWSDVLDRLATGRGSMDAGVWAGTDKPAATRTRRERARESFE